MSPTVQKKSGRDSPSMEFTTQVTAGVGGAVDRVGSLCSEQGLEITGQVSERESLFGEWVRGG